MQAIFSYGKLSPAIKRRDSSQADRKKEKEKKERKEKIG